MRLLTLIMVLSAFVLMAEDTVPVQLKAMQEQLNALQQKVENQQKTIDDQKKLINSMAASSKPVPGGPAADIIARSDILTRIERAEVQSAQAMRIAARKKPNDANMSIGAAVDTAFRYFDGNNDDSGARAGGNDFAVRTAELVFYADVDSYFKSYIVLATHQHEHEHGGGHGHEHGGEGLLEFEPDEISPILEEAAIYTTSLEHVQVKGGRFFAPFGRLSQIHNHDLPFVTRPGSIENYVGGESGADGVQVQATLPIDHFLQITGGVYNKVGGEFPLYNAPGRRSTAELTYLLKALTSFDIGDEHTLDVGLTTIQVPDSLIRRDLTNLEITYRWHPSGSSTRERLVWGTEVMRNQLRTRFVSNLEDVEELEDDPILARESRVGWGGYTYFEYFLNKHWSFGPRFDFYESVDPDEGEKRGTNLTLSLFATYKFSEFSRLRAEFSRHEFLNGAHANEFYLQWTVFWGAHTHTFDQR